MSARLIEAAGEAVEKDSMRSGMREAAVKQQED
jgi:hypothetical protein